jgi:hypothetical protein
MNVDQFLTDKGYDLESVGLGELKELFEAYVSSRLAEVSARLNELEEIVQWVERKCKAYPDICTIAEPNILNRKSAIRVMLHLAFAEAAACKRTYRRIAQEQSKENATLRAELERLKEQLIIVWECNECKWFANPQNEGEKCKCGGTCVKTVYAKASEHQIVKQSNEISRLEATVARLTGERDAQAEKRLDILLNDDCIRTIKKLTPEGGEEISFGGIMGGVRLKWSGPTVELPNLPSCRVSTGHCWIANEGNYKSKCINCNLLATWKLPTAESIDTETALSRTQQALRRLLTAIKAAMPTIDFYFKREIASPSNHQEFTRESSETIRQLHKSISAAEAASDTPQGAAVSEKEK